MVQFILNAWNKQTIECKVDGFIDCGGLGLGWLREVWRTFPKLPHMVSLNVMMLLIVKGREAPV